MSERENPKEAGLGLFTGDRVPRFDDDSLRQRVADDHAAQGPRSVALEEGISPRRSWQWNAPKGMPDLMKAIALAEGGRETETGVEFDTPKKPMCDFCSDPDPTWTHESADFTIDKVVPGVAHLGLPEYGSNGAFGACEACHSLIVADDWWGLYRRSVNEYRRHYGGIVVTEETRIGMYGVRGRDLVEQFVGSVHHGFRENRTGRWAPAGDRSWDSVLEPVPQSGSVSGVEVGAAASAAPPPAEPPTDQLEEER